MRPITTPGKVSRVVLLMGGMILLTAWGCGGSGDGSSDAVRTRKVSLFVTDSFREDIDQLLLTVYKVELLESDGAATVVYSDPLGHQFDAKSLRDSSGQLYNFLAASVLPPRTYTTVRLTLEDGFTIVPKGQLLTKTLAAEESLSRDASGNVVVSFPLRRPRDFSEGGSLILDVDLANFRYSGSRIVPSFAEATPEGLGDLSRHQSDEYRGVVSNLTEGRFELTLGNTRVLPVTLAPEAVIFGGIGPTSMLGNGEVVEVVGKFDVNSARFLASEVRRTLPSEGETEAGRPQVNGMVDTIQLAEGSGTISLKVNRSKGFLPAQILIPVEISSSTIFVARDGSSLSAAQFAAALKPGTKIYAEGTYSPEKNRFLAQLAKVE